LRSKPIEILGSGIGSLTEQETAEYMSCVLPDMFRLTAENKLKIDIETIALEEVEDTWQKKEDSGKRTVIRI
jgi:hypothetical protein